jgi:hypothetical protein
MKYSCSPEKELVRGHKQGASAVDEFSEGWPGWQVVGSCLAVGSNPAYSDIVPLRKLHLRTAWPWSIRSYLPHGPAATLRGLFQWLKFDPPSRNRARIINCVDVLLTILKPLVIPHLVASPAFHGHMCDWLSNGLRWVVVDGTPDEDEIEEYTHLVRERIMVMVNFHRFIFNHLNSTERKVFHAHAPEQLHSAFDKTAVFILYATRVISELKLLGPNESTQPLIVMLPYIEMVGGYISLLAQQIRADTTISGRFSDQLRIGTLSTEPVPTQRSVEHLRGQLTQLTNSERCAAPACITSIVDHHLRLCKGCYVVKYCSRRCQKRASMGSCYRRTPVALRIARSRAHQGRSRDDSRRVGWAMEHPCLPRRDYLVEIEAPQPWLRPSNQTLACTATQSSPMAP